MPHARRMTGSTSASNETAASVSGQPAFGSSLSELHASAETATPRPKRYFQSVMAAQSYQIFGVKSRPGRGTASRMWRSSLVLVALLVVHGGCGGSSSETPFPLEPEFEKQSASAPKRQVVFSGRDSDAAEEEVDEAETDPGAGPPPADTWGGKPKRTRKRAAPPLEPR